MQAYNKLIAAIIVPTVLLGLGAIGIAPDTPVDEAVTVLVTAFFVWLVPNKQ